MQRRCLPEQQPCWRGPDSLLQLPRHRETRLGDAAADRRCVRRGAISSRETCTGSSERARSEEHTSELQSLMRISYAVFCLKKKNTHRYNPNNTTINEEQAVVKQSNMHID